MRLVDLGDRLAPTGRIQLTRAEDARQEAALIAGLRALDDFQAAQRCIDHLKPTHRTAATKAPSYAAMSASHRARASPPACCWRYHCIVRCTVVRSGHRGCTSSTVRAFAISRASHPASWGPSTPSPNARSE